MTRRTPPLLLVVALTVAAVGAVAAVLRAAVAESDEGPPSDPRAAAVAALGTRPGDIADSARYVVRYLVEDGAGFSLEIGRFEGVADFARRRFLAQGRFGGGSGAPTEFDSFVFSEWEYQRRDGETRWKRDAVAPQELGQPVPDLAVVGVGNESSAPAYATDRDARTTIVDALVSEVRSVGVEDQHGSTVWHYRVNLDGDRAAGILPEELRSETVAWDEGQGHRELDLWLDGRGRMRKLSISFTGDGESGHRVENELWDYGGPGLVALPPDLGDPTSVGGEGVSSFTLEPGVDSGEEASSLRMSVFAGGLGEAVALEVQSRPVPRANYRRREISMMPPTGGELQPGEYRLGGYDGPNGLAPGTFHVQAPEIDERCHPDGARSGTLTLTEVAVYREEPAPGELYQTGYYVRLHARFVIDCPAVGDGTLLSFTGEARYHALT